MQQCRNNRAFTTPVHHNTSITWYDGRRFLFLSSKREQSSASFVFVENYCLDCVICEIVQKQGLVIVKISADRAIFTFRSLAAWCKGHCNGGSKGTDCTQEGAFVLVTCHAFAVRGFWWRRFVLCAPVKLSKFPSLRLRACQALKSSWITFPRVWIKINDARCQNFKA